MCLLCLCAATECRKLVAAGLWQTGYHADWMYGKEEGEGGEGGRFLSRDLLLALGWLLATGQLEKLLSKRVQKLDKKLLSPTPVNTTGTPSQYTGKPNCVCEFV